MRRVVISWSSGKDSAWALHVLRNTPDIEIVGLLTTFNQAADRVAMHAVRRELVHAQADQLKLPLLAVELPWPCSNDHYETLMGECCARVLRDGVTHIAFGDLFLADVRAYRERQLEGSGLEPLFPLWQLETHSLAREMLRGGIRARLTCIDPRTLDRRFAGVDFNDELLDTLPPEVDPCGERGEFHTFVYAAPDFERPLEIETGEILERDGFVFTDVQPRALKN